MRPYMYIISISTCAQKRSALHCSEAGRRMRRSHPRLAGLPVQCQNPSDRCQSPWSSRSARGGRRPCWAPCCVRPWRRDCNTRRRSSRLAPHSTFCKARIKNNEVVAVLYCVTLEVILNSAYLSVTRGKGGGAGLCNTVMILIHSTIKIAHTYKTIIIIINSDLST